MYDTKQKKLLKGNFPNQLVSYQLKAAPGFTLIEMIVVVGIIAMITGMFLINFNGLRGARDLKIAQNQLVTDIRKLQSFTLSSTNISANGKPASYYVIKFNKVSNPNSYTIGAIDNGDPKGYVDIQTVNFPQNVIISSLTIVSSSGTPTSVACAESAFALPFGRVSIQYPVPPTYPGCDFFNYISNSNDLSQFGNLVLSVSLSDTSNPTSAPRVVTINGISQAIEFVQ